MFETAIPTIDKSECKDEKLNIRIISNTFMWNREAMISDGNKYTKTTNNSWLNVNEPEIFMNISRP